MASTKSGDHLESDASAHELSPTPPLRPITKVYLASLTAATLSTLLSLLTSAGLPGRHDGLLAFAVGAGVTLAYLAPINQGHRTQETLDVIVVLAAILLLQPGIAMLAVGLGPLLATAIRRHRTWAESIFNGATTALEAAAGGLVLVAIGWDTGAPRFALPQAVLATVLAGVAMYLVAKLALAAVISFQERLPLLTVWYDSTLGFERAEMLVYPAQLGIGLLAAIVANAEPWALALLLLPAIAVYTALEQHVAVRRRAEANLAEAQRIAQLGSLDWNVRKGDQRWSDELCRILGLAPDAAASRAAYLGVVHPADRPVVEAALDAATRAGTAYGIDHRIVRPDGVERIIHSRGEVVRGRGGQPERIVGTMHDVTERKRLEDKLAHQAFHDPLTDLPNRALFTRRLDQALERVERRRSEIAVLFLDLDRFKLINDTLGHEAGDQLLITVAQRLRTATRPADTVARLGGDEFTVLLEQAGDRAEVERVAERITAALAEPMTLVGTREIVVTTSIGIVWPGPDHQTGADLLRDADVALYRAKEGGRARFAVFDASMGAATRERVALEADLRRAIERDELRVLYQPKIELATGKTVAVEALIRWAHPKRGWVAPTAFIPIAEETGLIQPVGRWILNAACREAATWGALCAEPPALSVNVSGRQLHDPDLVADLERLLGETALEPRRLRLEITESVAMKNAEATIAALRKLQGAGVRVVIDDFGTGYSSLSSLRRFPVDTLQLDRSFVAELGRNREATTIAQAVIGLAHGLGLKVVAEGVEQGDQLAQLRALGCEQAQGNYFARPMDGPALAAYLRRPPGQPAGPIVAEAGWSAGELVDSR